MTDRRIIKRYPNRRLYDFAQSRYVTLQDVRKLVMDRVEFVVKDHASQADVTCRVLLQIMIEEAGAREPVISAAILAHLIRSRSFRARLSRHFELDCASHD